MSRRRGYKYWIFARLDWLWLYLPPALSVFEDADPAAVWIPDGQDTALLSSAAHV